jgi:hypothetical protein
MAADGSTHVIDFHFTVQLGELLFHQVGHCAGTDLQINR